MYVHQTPVGMVAPAILWAGLAIFGLLVFLKKDGGSQGEAEARRSGLSVLGIAIQVVAFAAVGFGEVTFLYAPLSPQSLEQAAATLFLAVATCLIFAASKRALGRNWSVVARTRSDHELVTWGPFAYVRHPIYSALFLWMLAMAVALGHYWGLILGVPLYWLGTILRIREEERLLRAQFGPDYEGYAKRVKRFVPGII
jgi:protein-S-isoprenylcysteine O-methyltransferase Ste14